MKCSSIPIALALLFAPFAFFCGHTLPGQEPVRSGLAVGKRPGPYASLVVVGPQRGTQHCFVCEAENKPVVIVFARTTSEPLGKLVAAVDGVVKKNAMADVRAWTTFLAADAGPLEPQVVAWSQKYATGNVPITIFEDVVGPPAYRVARDADVTVLVAKDQKISAAFAFRAGELNDASIKSVVEAAGKVAVAK